MPEKDVVGNVTSDLIALLPTSHIIAYITIWQLLKFMRKHAMLTAK